MASSTRAVGVAALQKKDFPTATKSLRVAVEATPNDFSIVYPLALAYLQSTPPDVVNGSGSPLAPPTLRLPQMQAQIEKYGKSQYTKYHGSDQGWTDVMAQAKTRLPACLPQASPSRNMFHRHPRSRRLIS